MPLGVHGAPGIHLPKIGVDRFTNYIQVHCVSFPFDQMTAMTALVSGGVFDRHPRLRVAFLEAGVTWVPYFIDRLHEHWEKRGDVDPERLAARPARVRRARADLRHVRARRDGAARGVDALGPDFVMYASDYPHWDGEFPKSTRALRTRTDLSGRGARFWGERARFYALPGPRIDSCAGWREAAGWVRLLRIAWGELASYRRDRLGGRLTPRTPRARAARDHGAWRRLALRPGVAGFASAAMKPAW